jgi:hypothetical protein
MLSDFLAFRVAVQHVQCLSQETAQFSSRRLPSLAKVDSEHLIRLAIEAFEWTLQADQRVHSAIYREHLEFNPTIDAEFDVLFGEWLSAGDAILKDIQFLEQTGVEPELLSRLLACIREVRAILNPNYTLHEAMRTLADEAVQAYHRGETDEWIVGDDA